MNEITAEEVLALVARVKDVAGPQEAQAIMQELAAIHGYLSERYCHFHAERRIGVAKAMARLRGAIDDKGKQKYTLGDAEALALMENEEAYRAEYRFRGLLDSVNEAIQVLKMRGRLYMAEMQNLNLDE